MGRDGQEPASQLCPRRPRLPPGVSWAGRGQARGCRPGDGTPSGGRQTEKRHKNLPGLRPAGSASGNSGGRVEREAPGEPQLSRTRRWLFLSPRGVLCGNWGFQARSAAQLPSSLPLFSISPSLEGGSGPGRLRARKAGGRGPGPGRGTRGAPFTEHTPGRAELRARPLQSTDPQGRALSVLVQRQESGHREGGASASGLEREA